MSHVRTHPWKLQPTLSFFRSLTSWRTCTDFFSSFLIMIMRVFYHVGPYTVITVTWVAVVNRDVRAPNSFPVSWLYLSPVSWRRAKTQRSAPITHPSKQSPNLSRPITHTLSPPPTRQMHPPQHVYKTIPISLTTYHSQHKRWYTAPILHVVYVVPSSSSLTATNTASAPIAPRLSKITQTTNHTKHAPPSCSQHAPQCEKDTRALLCMVFRCTTEWCMQCYIFRPKIPSPSIFYSIIL